MAEILANQVLEAYHAADFVKAAWLPEKGRLRSSTLDINSLTGIINAGKMAAEIGLLTQEEAQQYHQDAITTVSDWYAGFCNSDNYSQSKAAGFMEDFRNTIGEKEANEALITAFALRKLKHQKRQTVIAGLENNNQAVLTVFNDAKNFLRFGIINDEQKTRKAVIKGFKAEVERRGIGTEVEQIKHLLWLNLGRLACPIVYTTAAVTIISGSSWGMFAFAVNNQTANPELITASPAVVFIVDSLLFLKSAGFTTLALTHPDIKEQRKNMKYPLAAFLNSLRQFLVTGQAPGTPRLEGSDPSI